MSSVSYENENLVFPTIAFDVQNGYNKPNLHLRFQLRSFHCPNTPL